MSGWLWSNATPASSSKPPAAVNTPEQGNTVLLTEASAGPSSRKMDNSSAKTGSSAATEEELATAAPADASRRYERILRDEEKYQAKQYPSFEEVPGCMQLFDEFMMCYALVPQLRSFYRRGDFHDCSWKFRDFKYCLSLKSEPEDRRTELWTKRRAEWWANRRFEGSSEDVWDLRDKPPANFPPVYADDDPAVHQVDAEVVK